MKTIKQILLLAVCLVAISNESLAQRTISLRDFEILKHNYQTNPDTGDDGDDITYVKDVNNELNKYVGVWKGSVNSRNYEIAFTKQTAYKSSPNQDAGIDLLKGLITVKNNSGGIIFTNANKAQNLNGFTGVNFQTGTNVYRMNFTGQCYNDSGQAFIELIPSTGKIILQYGILSDIQTSDCPAGFTPVLPTNAPLSLTKQP